jgi:2-methylisocitrate lyase-like PEP mutase family enzyme
MDIDKLARLGYRIVVFPGGTARAVAFALQDYFRSLKDNGTTVPMKEKMLDFEGLNAVIGTPELLKLGGRY